MGAIARKLKILVVDDEENSRVMLRQMASLMGHETVLAKNGQEAVRLFEDESPDIVLMDVMMPVLDGYAATRRIRELPMEKWVPVVFLSALDRPANLLRGLDAGGDDYIAKPVNLAELQAKIRALQRVAVLQASLAEKRQLLEAYFRRSEEDARIGSHIMERLTSRATLSDNAVRVWTRSVHHFSGDLVAAARTPANVLYVMLADAVGHGLPAALNALPLAETFYDMAGAGFPLARVIEEMDRKIKQLLPIDRFVTATLLSVNEYGKELQIWNGGNPTPIYYDADGNAVALERATRMPLGLLQDLDTDAQPEIMAFQGEGQILLLTDGLCEAQGADGSYFGCGEVLARLKDAAPGQRLAQLVATFGRHLGKVAPHDDVSVMLVETGRRAPPEHASAPPRSLAHPRSGIDSAPDMLGWKAEFRLGVRELTSLDVVPFLTMVVERLEIGGAQRQHIFMILSELFNNALEHGLLELDSNMKSTFEGFQTYMAERSRRLQALAQGRIDIALERMQLNGKLVLQIRIRDSGSGFDHAAAAAAQADPQSRRLHGRGIMLVKSLTHSLQYLGTGNEAVVHYRL